MTPLETAKEKVGIPVIARHLGVTLEKEHGSMCSPFRPDKNPSFSIYDNGRRWKDHATGEGGDVISFIELATRKNCSDACKLLIEIAETGKGSHMHPFLKEPARAVQESQAYPSIPLLEHGSITELATLARQRGFPVWAGIELAYERGLFGFCDYMGHRCWIIKDPSGRVAQARRLDGLPFDNGVKALTLKDAKACWPIGYSTIGDAKLVLNTEGGTDFLTAITAAWLQLDGNIDHITFCSILGANQKIHPDALKHFKGKHVVIYADNDPPGSNGRNAGIDGAKEWRKQLRSIAERVDIFTPDTEGQDLNDEARMKWDAWGEDDPFPDILEIETLHPAKIQRNVKNKTELYNEDSS